MSKNITKRSRYKDTVKGNKVDKSATVRLTFAFTRTATKKYREAVENGDYPTTMTIHLTSPSAIALERLKTRIVQADIPPSLAQHACSSGSALLSSRTTTGDFQSTVNFRQPIERVGNDLVKARIITKEQRESLFPQPKQP